ncbi:hypothetical protein CPB84DRAFT_538601 [Gymnopilus junonius]|uniref:Uncharacterized protein n=1 Tax=Gymnopilus junonius TaxID=109634 RepID=A0A9P5NTN3_GYMJU|nr:hypothetical protein CPB84DRAFT_538601 [Gymnopilus junonius]
MAVLEAPALEVEIKVIMAILLMVGTKVLLYPLAAKICVQPNAPAPSRTSEETPTAPVGGSNPTPVPSPTLDAGFNTTSDTGSDTTSVNESNTSSVSTTASASPSSNSQAAAGSTNSGQNSDTANGQTGSISSPVPPGQEPTSFNPSGLPFGADPTGVDGVGIAPSNTASAGSGSGISSTSAATSQGPDASPKEPNSTMCRVSIQFPISILRKQFSVSICTEQ